ncbi:MAG: M24 family metallopeptidase [Burkholderiaceae bacterium]|nr:M24 family metallopeptidase [Burkholderiaceae bacterium]
MPRTESRRIPSTVPTAQQRDAAPFARRRAELARRMRAEGGGVAVVFTAPEVARNRDTEYPYRFDSYFHHLTGFPEPQSVVVIIADAGAERSILFCRSKNEEREIWDGFRHGPEAARERFGLDEAYPIEELDALMPRLLADRPAVFYALGSDAGLDAHVQRWLGGVRAQSRAGVSAPYRALDVTRLLDEMRLVKDDDEIAIMRAAARISAGAHVRAMRFTRPGCHEYEVEAELLHEFRRHGSEFPAYGSIVAGGANACVLHYRGNDARLADGDLLLIDAGCELQGYASDITRTFPVSGRFSPAQRELYDIVLAAQAAAQAATRPGRHFMEPHDAAVRVLAQGMIDCGLLEGSVDGVIESGAYRRYYMHRTSHWLGRDVHDCGDYREPIEEARPVAGGTGASTKPAARGRTAAKAGAGAKTAVSAGAKAKRGAARKSGRGSDAPASTPERPWRRLVPGMVLTLEPGIYVRAAADVPAHFHDIGIRIEDDAVVTARGCEILTGDVPKRATDIEALMAEGREAAGARRKRRTAS